jgi:hypothetical protein
VDNQLFRVGGTGILLEKVGAKQKRGYVDSYVFPTTSPGKPGKQALAGRCTESAHGIK